MEMNSSTKTMNDPLETTDVACGFSRVTDDILDKIFRRLPAPAFASAACVSPTWNRVCSRILSRPKLSSALSINPSLQDAVKEVLDKVLSEPIRPHFGIAYIAPQFNLEEAHQLIMGRLGSKTPLITNETRGIIGTDVNTNQHKEVQWIGEGDGLNSDENNGGIVLVVGFLPGFKVNVFPLYRPERACQVALVDHLLIGIREYTNSVSGKAWPSGIIMFGDKNSDMRTVLAKLDFVLPSETFLVGDAGGSFLYRSSDESRNFTSPLYAIDAVALVFVKDKNKPHDIGETQFHVTMSTGLLPFGPEMKAVSVSVNAPNISWITARLEEENEIIIGEMLVEDIKYEIGGDECRNLYIGVTQHWRSTSKTSGNRRVKTLAFYEVFGGDGDCFIVDGTAVRPGDSFLFYHSDLETASSSCANATAYLEGLKEELNNRNLSKSVAGNQEQQNAVFGGLMFSCHLRGESFFGAPNVDSSPFISIFPGVPLAGAFCAAGEIIRPCTLKGQELEDEDQNSAGCCLNMYSSVYLLMSYAPASPEN